MRWRVEYDKGVRLQTNSHFSANVSENVEMDYEIAVRSVKNTPVIITALDGDLNSKVF